MLSVKDAVTGRDTSISDDGAELITSDSYNTKFWLSQLKIDIMSALCLFKIHLNGYLCFTYPQQYRCASRMG